MKHQEKHRSEAIGWLRAAVLGANDGLISTSSLIVGVAAAQATRDSIILTGCAGLVAGALSMAAGEYVSVSSQADSERADLERERRELEAAPDLEHAELARVYVARGVSPELAQRVAAQLMAKDALGAHAREEIGLSEITRARPLQAALTSAAAFAIGAVPPLAIAWLAPTIANPVDAYEIRGHLDRAFDLIVKGDEVLHGMQLLVESLTEFRRRLGWSRWQE